MSSAAISSTKSLANLSVRNLELDEIWTYVAKKQKRCRGNDLRNQTIGDQYLYTALDADSKMVITFAIGKRTSEVTAAFVADLEKRIVRQPSADADDIPQISTDGWGPYMPSIARSFGRSARHGVLIKQYVDPSVGRYAPPDLVRTERINIRGIKDLGTICTSHVERLNGSIRLFMKRFTSPDLCVLKEAGEPCRCDRVARRGLQLRPHPSIAGLYACDGCGSDRRAVGHGPAV